MLESLLVLGLSLALPSEPVLELAMVLQLELVSQWQWELASESGSPVVFRLD